VKPRYIYALIDPRYDEVRYIGTSTDPWTRVYLPYVPGRPWQSHVAQALNGGKTHKDYWLQGISSAGLLPLMTVLEWGVWTVEQCAEREIWWISFYREIGTPLLNQSGGGEQTPLWKMSDETRALISKHTKEAMARPEVIAKGEAARALYREKNPPRRPVTPEEQEARLENGRRKNREHSASVWASYTPEQRAERGHRISEAKFAAAKKRPRKTPVRVFVGDARGLGVSIANNLSKARRNGWTLPIVSKVDELLARLNQK
jgi:hypothetical protein